MTKPSQILMTSIALLVLCATAPALLLAKGPPIKVTESIPATGEQGTTIKTVKLRGENFEPGTPQIRFYLSSTGTQVPEAKLKAVGVNRISAEEIQYDLVIGLEADPVEYDIEVYYSSKRKGKGTTLFNVQAKSNQTTVACSEVFDFESPGTGSSCTCVFNPPDNDPSYGLLGDCVTSETLFLKTGFRTDGSVQSSGPLNLTLTAVPCGTVAGQGCTGFGDEKFLGSSVITNRAERVSVRFLNIRFADGVTRGCVEDADNPDIQTAISFVLDENTIDDPDKNSLLTVFDINIDTNNGSYNDPLCTAVEVVRTPDFDNDQVFANQDWRMMVENVEIAEGSYQETGIRLEGMHPTQSINPPIVSNNYIGAPDCSSSDDAAGIWFGRILLSDPLDDSSQIAGQLESNTIRMENSECFSVGIKVVGEPCTDSACTVGNQTTAEVIKNVISGADVGVEVDENILNVHFSGNTLIGDSGDTGICSEASSTSTKGKPNVWSGYDAGDEIDYGPCY